MTERLAAPPDRADLLGMMMAASDDEASETMSPRQLHDEMMGMLMAGHETTGIASAWCWHWISQSPEIEARFHAELDSVLGGRAPTFEDLNKLDLHPHDPAGSAAHHAADLGYRPPRARGRRDRRLRDSEGHECRAQLVRHAPHPGYWESPGTFDPERFRDDRAAARPTYAYFPFGGGPRRCVGLRFAMLEAQLILAVLGQSFSLRPQPGATVSTGGAHDAAAEVTASR